LGLILFTFSIEYEESTCGRLFLLRKRSIPEKNCPRFKMCTSSFYHKLAILAALHCSPAFAWIQHSVLQPRTLLQSTPFELDYYDDSNPFSGSQPPLACPPDTKLVLGLNKYSHDTSICAANAKTGEVLFAISKERLTRKKCDGGNVALLVETCLESLDLNYDSIEKVVMNNHHHRILPLEENRAHMEWESGLGINGGAESGYDDEENLLLDAQKVRTSILVDDVRLWDQVVPLTLPCMDSID
jgi:hypothetical protein